MDDKFYVRTIIRDDGKRFDFDGYEIYLSSDNSLLERPDIDSSEVNYTDADGGEMIGQRLQIAAQSLVGVIYPRETDYWTLYFKLGSFFQINYHYTIIYKRRSGELFAQRNAWLFPNIKIHPPAKEDFSVFTFGFKLKSSTLYEYAEDDDGNEIYANSVILPLLTASSGGEMWDEIGQVSDAIGSVWSAGSGGVQSVEITSILPIYPIWTVVGESVNPSLQNNTTDSFAVYDGTIASGQTLVVDFASGVAKLDGATVTRNLIGQVKFTPGNNVAGFNSEGGATTNSKIEWNNAIG